MRQAFFQPIVNNIKKGRLPWVFEEIKKGLVHKYLNKILPKKILIGPTMAILAVTYRCNSYCLMCDLPQRGYRQKRKEFNTREWMNIIDQLSDLKTAGIGFTGGEPLLRPDIFTLLAFAKKKGMSVTLNTNGLLFDAEKIYKTLSSAPDNINLSLDGTNAKTHDFLRGLPGSFTKTTQNIKNLVQRRNQEKYQTAITIITCVSSANIDSLSGIARLGASLGVDKIGFIPLHHLPSLQIKDKSHNIGKKFLREIEKIRQEKILTLDNSREYLKMFPQAFLGQKFPLPCLATTTSLTLDCYGNIYPCWPFLELKRYSLSLPQPISAASFTPRSYFHGTERSEVGVISLWNSKKYEALRKKVSSCRACFWNCHSELSIFYK